MMYPIIKRCIDIFASALGLIVLAPVFFVIAILIRITEPGSILYRAPRVGKGGTMFTMLKFRSMVINADKIGGPSTAGDDLRVTRIGRILRRYKLDELPELVNVLRGEMSLVGPRPEVKMYIDMMSPEERSFILSVPPGITDWASLWNFHEEDVLAGAIDPEQAYQEKIWPEKKRLQMKYVKEQSLINDLKIIAQTIKKLVR